jgi:intracellular septation protein A
MLTHDPRFIMVKPALIYVAVGFVMLRRGWMRRYIPPIAAGHIDDLTDVFGYVWAALMFVTAAANLIVAVWFTQYWIAFVAMFPVASKVALFAIQYLTSRTIARRRILAQRASLAETPALA